MSSPAFLRRKLRQAQKALEAYKKFESRPKSYRPEYADKPAEYIENVLRGKLTPTQRKICEACLLPPHRVLVPSGHDVGKTWLGAALVSWWFDTRDPSVCLTTAPKLDQVRDLLWKEIRSQRSRVGLGGFPGPKSLRLETGPKHFAKGVTANTQAGFQGQHEKNVLVLIDEAEGVERDYFEAAKTMASGAGHCIVCFYNPYSSASHVAQEEIAVDERGNPSWRMISMSSLDHPNIAAELSGGEPEIPQAVRLHKVNQWVVDWCQPLTGEDIKVTDIEWPPSKWTGTPGKWYRPGPRFEAGALGRRPTLAVDSVWSVALVDECCRRGLPANGRVQIGVDVARFGDDYTCFHVVQGGVSVHHEAVNGWSVVETAQRAMQLACAWCDGNDPRSISICVDDCGVGGGVTDILVADRWNAIGVNAGMHSPDDERYDNMRSALWCDLAEEAKKGNVDFSRLSKDVQMHLRRELPSQQYKLDARGRRCCLPKSVVKQQLGRSPDNADAVMLAFCNAGMMRELIHGQVEVIG